MSIAEMSYADGRDFWKEVVSQYYEKKVKLLEYVLHYMGNAVPWSASCLHHTTSYNLQAFVNKHS